MNRISELRKKMKEKGIDYYLIVSDDFHASEYVGDYFKCREYISGFTGSAGTCVITETKAGLWTDGRYFIQAENQLRGSGIHLYKMGEENVPSLMEYLQDNVKDGDTLAYDGRTITENYANRIKDGLKGKKVFYIENVDLVGEIWKDRPVFPCRPVWLLDEALAGKSRKAKLEEVRKEIKAAGADYFLLASLDDIAWLYNMRGNDIAYNPVAMAYSLMDQNGDTTILYCNEEVISPEVRKQLEKDGVELRGYFQVYEDLGQLPNDKQGHTLTILMDDKKTNVALVLALPDLVKVIYGENPTLMAKAVKTKAEMENERKAHIKDGVAVTKLIYWLKNIQNTLEFQQGRITELSVANKLLKIRKEQEGFIEESFAPIVATGEHGAIVHYEADEESNVPIEKDTFLLMDTGGQYLQGTTDITRTIGIGNLTRQQKEHYTAVLRGNLNLAMAYFKYGAAGGNLDYLARNPLWEYGLGYNHGTGHGVGYLLNVHEGPNAIRMKNVDGQVGVPFEEGMITSDEPGLYLEGKYGIRLENLLLCLKDKKTEYGQFMKFETLTLVPFDREAILPELMSERELDFMNDYHERVYVSLEKYLTPEERQWLYTITRPIGKG